VALAFSIISRLIVPMRSTLLRRVRFLLPSLVAPEFTRCVQHKPSALGEVVETLVRGAPYQLAEHGEHMVALVFGDGEER